MSRELTSTKTDSILNRTNRLNVTKGTSAWVSDEFSNIITDISELYSKLVAKGKVKEEEAEAFYNDYYSQFTTSNCDNYFDSPHKNLPLAANRAKESIDVALISRVNTDIHSKLRKTA